MYFETHLFPFWERTKNVLRHTNECNIDSLMGKKKMSAVFRDSCLSQSGGIDDAKVSDWQRRCCAPWRNIISCKSSFTCHVPLGFFAFGLVGCNSRGDLSLVLIMILCYLAPVTRYSSQFTFQVFFPKAVFGSLENLLLIVVLHITLWFKRHRLGIVQTVDLLNMMQLTHILSRFSYSLCQMPKWWRLAH